MTDDDLPRLLDRLVTDVTLRRIPYEADRTTFHILQNAAINQLIRREHTT